MWSSSFRYLNDIFSLFSFIILYFTLTIFYVQFGSYIYVSIHIVDVYPLFQVARRVQPISAPRKSLNSASAPCRKNARFTTTQYSRKRYLKWFLEDLKLLLTIVKHLLVSVGGVPDTVQRVLNSEIVIIIVYLGVDGHVYDS